MFFLYSISNKDKLAELAETSKSQGFLNIAFNCYLQINDLEKCLDVLILGNQISEACLFCRTYLPSKLSHTMSMWNEAINEIDPSCRTSKKSYILF